MKLCKRCGKEIPSTRRANAIYCSENCMRDANVAGVYRRISDSAQKRRIANELYERYGYKCAICGWQATPDLIKTKRGYIISHGNELHHITPVENGGEAKEGNLILLCPNHHKQADLGIITPEELKKYYIAAPSEKELISRRDRAIERVTNAIANAIFGTQEDH